MIQSDTLNFLQDKEEYTVPFPNIVEITPGNDQFQDGFTELYLMRSGLPNTKATVIGPMLYLLYAADIQTSLNSTIAKFTDDMPILAVNNNPVVAPRYIQSYLKQLQDWLRV